MNECEHEFVWTDMTGEYVCIRCHVPKRALREMHPDFCKCQRVCGGDS